MRITQEIPSTVLDTDSQDNALATATATPGTNQSVYVTGINASYSTNSTTGLLQIKEDGVVKFESYVHGNRQFNFPSALKFDGTVTVELAASGTAGTIGKVNLRGYLL